MDDCPECGGLGYVEERHPLWGARNCPEPTVEVQCPVCHGRGIATEDELFTMMMSGYNE